MLLMTSIIAAILTIIFVKAFAVIGLRRKNKVGLGSGVTTILKELFALKVTLPSMCQLDSF